MSGKLKEVRTRISSVQNTQQITKAMKLVSAAKLRRAQEAIVSMRPYAKGLEDILHNITTALEGEVDMKLAEQRPVEKSLVVLITSDRGLAGSYNSNLIKLAGRVMKETYADQYEKGNVTLMGIGKRGAEYYARRMNTENVDRSHMDLFLDLTYANCRQVANEIMDAFVAGTYDRVNVVFSEFKNAAYQEFQNEQLLPVQKKEKDQQETFRHDYIYEPSVQVMIEELIPRIIRVQFYKFMLDAQASEHGARMTAMDKATENASELLKDLRVTYNRARQAAITKEISEIVSGAAALEDS